MSYQTMTSDWCKPHLDSYSEPPIDDDAHDESDIGDGSHRFLTTKTRRRRTWVRRCGKTERDAIQAFYETHKTVLYFYYPSPAGDGTFLVRFAAPIDPRPHFMGKTWDIEISVVDV